MAAPLESQLFNVFLFLKILKTTTLYTHSFLIFQRYPDVSQEQLYLLLLLRGDLNKTESRQMATEFCPEVERGKASKSVGQAKSVFSQVTLATTSSNVFAEAASAVASATTNREKNLNPFGEGF